MNLVYIMLTATLIYSIPTLITGLGGLFSEKSGTVNIGLEGTMMFGAFFGITATLALESSFPNVSPLVGVLVGGIIGIVISALHALASVKFKADHVITGVAINMLALSMTPFLSKIIHNSERTPTRIAGINKVTMPILSKIPIIGDIFFTRIYPTVYLGFILVILTWFVVYKTSFGLKLRACGENPSAADTAGIAVNKMRLIGLLISGFLAGMSGAIFVLTVGISYSTASIGGIGFIALAALIFGRWNPFGVLGASLVFSFSTVLSIYSDDISFLKSFPNEFFYALPYVLTVIALIVFAGKSIGPKAVGQVYEAGQR